MNTKCGGRILVTRGAEKHLEAHPEVSSLLAEACGRIDLPDNGSFLSTEVEMERVVGKAGRVKLSPDKAYEPALFAQRVGRRFPSRVTFDEAEDTTKVVVLARSSGLDTYELVSSWVGPLAPREPWDESLSWSEYVESLDFWSTHALVYNPAVMSEPFTSSWGAILTR